MLLEFKQVDTDVHKADAEFHDYQLFKNKAGTWYAHIVFDGIEVRRVDKPWYQSAEDAQQACQEDFDKKRQAVI